MNWVDTVITAILGLNVFNGLRRGFILSLFDILAVVLAVILSMKWYSYGIELLTETFKMSEPIAYVTSFALTWVAIYCAISVVGAILHKFLAFSFLRPLDVFGGAAFGFIKGMIFAAVIFVPLTLVPYLPSNLTEAIEDSRILEWARPTIRERTKNVRLGQMNKVRTFVESTDDVFQ